jgi:DNA (cytosine-5)-methyltransferase 1
MAAYYNEHDRFAAAWLRELIKAGLIADGEVDERSITDVRPDDLRGFVQCHFFAGIGGWSYALRLAGWPDDRHVWTGSCPCQPWSMAGRRDGPTDSRDLWPTWFQLIAQCRPPVMFGEQVASRDGLHWLDRVYADLESCDYAVGAADLAGGSVGSPDIRQRLWFVADAQHAERRTVGINRAEGHHGPDSRRPEAHGELGTCGEVRVVADARGERCDGQSVRVRVGQPRPTDAETAGGGEAGELGHADGLGGSASGVNSASGEAIPTSSWQTSRTASGWAGFWADCTWIPCRDGKWRPVESGTFPLAHGVSGRVGRLRGYGNAIKPQVAAAFIQAYLESEEGR